jgi:hypothetical protein
MIIRTTALALLLSGASAFQTNLQVSRKAFVGAAPLASYLDDLSAKSEASGSTGPKFTGGGGYLDSITGDDDVAEVVIAVVEEPVPEPEPVIEEPEPVAVVEEAVPEPEPVIEEPEPVAVVEEAVPEPEPVIEEPEPVALVEEAVPEPEPVIEEPEPVAAVEEPVPEPEPVIEEPEPVAVVEEPVPELEPVIEEPEPAAVVEEPVPEPEPVLEEPEPVVVAVVEPVPAPVPAPAPAPTRPAFVRPKREPREKGGSMVIVNEEAIEFTAGLVGGAVGFALGGPVVGLAAATVSNYFSKQDEDISEVVKAVSVSAIQTFNYVTKVNDRYEILEKTQASLEAILDGLRENPSVDAAVVDQVETALIKTAERMAELNQKFDVPGATSNYLGVIGGLVERTVKGVANLNEQYKLTEGFFGLIEEATAIAKVATAEAAKGAGDEVVVAKDEVAKDAAAEIEKEA